jgi:hypothetical protein
VKLLVPPAICALCLSRADLPAFLKETSATGFLRGAEAPNLRRQDLMKERLLCVCCEGRFAIWEKEFKEKALATVQSDNFTNLRYGPWLMHFVVSLSWRVLVAQRELMIGKYPQFTDDVNATLENWRLFLLEQRRRPNSEHHLFVFAGVPESLPAEWHKKSLHYLLRAIDATTAGSGRTLFVYTKALRSLIFSPIVPASPAGWINTRVHPGHGRLVSPQKIAMRGFADFLNSRVVEGFAQPLSVRQQSKIDEAILNNPRRALSSESYKVHKATKRLRADVVPDEGN